MRSAVRARIEEEAGLPYYHPFDIHILRPEEAAAYLRRAGPDLVRL
ncbi:MAG: hypothetical protein ACP5HK_06855 [Acidilobus sp.]